MNRVSSSTYSVGTIEGEMFEVKVWRELGKNAMLVVGLPGEIM